MKTAYELAMEKLKKGGPSVSMTDTQKKDLAELDARYAAKIAEREIFLKAELEKAMGNRDYEGIQQITQQMTNERRKFQVELDEKKELVRQGKKLPPVQ